MRKPATLMPPAITLAAMVRRYQAEFPDLTVDDLRQYIRQADRDSPQYDAAMIAEMRDDPDFLDFLFDIRMESAGGRFAMLLEGAINDLPAPEGPALSGALAEVVAAGGPRAMALRLVARDWF